MLVRIHVLLSLFFLVFYKNYGIYSVVALISSVLIDFDHYLIYVIRKKDLCLRNAIKCHVDSKKPIPLVFHNVYFMLFVYLLSIYFKDVMIYSFDIGIVFRFMLYGFLYHLFFDILYFFMMLFVPDLAYKLGVKKKYTKKQLVEKLSMRLFLNKKFLTRFFSF